LQLWISLHRLLLLGFGLALAAAALVLTARA
jgi:hypothetical protein